MVSSAPPHPFLSLAPSQGLLFFYFLDVSSVMISKSLKSMLTADTYRFTEPGPYLLTFPAPSSQDRSITIFSSTLVTLATLKMPLLVYSSFHPLQVVCLDSTVFQMRCWAPTALSSPPLPCIIHVDNSLFRLGPVYLL